MTSKINEKTIIGENALERSKGGEDPCICSVKAAKPVGCDPHAAYADGIVCARNGRGGRKSKRDRTLMRSIVKQRGREPS